MIKYLVIDVDGTMTDAGIYYDELGNEFKKFCTKDAAGFFAAHYVGIKIIVLTGRESAATARRMKEMNVDYLHQNIKDKVTFLKEFMQSHNIAREDVGYIGDDINDFVSMQLCGYVICPADSCKEVKSISNYICQAKGGAGAVREAIEYYLTKEKCWDLAICNIYGSAGY